MGGIPRHAKDQITAPVRRRRSMTGRYEELHTRSISDPEGFWGDAASEIDWIKPWDTVLDSSNPPFYRWFKGGVLNTAYNAVDRHVEAGRGEQAAIIYDSPSPTLSRPSPMPAARPDRALRRGA